MVGDFYTDKFKRDEYAKFFKQPQPLQDVTKEEFEALKKEVLDMKELIKRAIDYDKRNNEPHCETENKIALLKQVAEMVGVDLKDIV